jgi:3-methyladenine DNA glycosylase AlkC
VVGEGTLSRRRMLGLAGGALAGVLLAPLSLSGGEASANQVSPSLTQALASGTYYIQQKSNNQYLDAYQTEPADFAVVTRSTKQTDNTQKWVLTPV